MANRWGSMIEACQSASPPGTTHSASQIAARLQRPRSEGRKYLPIYGASRISQEAAPPAARASAAGILLDRAGAARHSSTHDEDGKEIRVTTRKMLEDDDED